MKTACKSIKYYRHSMDTMVDEPKLFTRFVLLPTYAE